MQPHPEMRAFDRARLEVLIDVIETEHDQLVHDEVRGLLAEYDTALELIQEFITRYAQEKAEREKPNIWLPGK